VRSDEASAISLRRAIGAAHVSPITSHLSRFSVFPSSVRRPLPSDLWNTRFPSQKVSVKFSPDEMPDPLKNKDVRWRQRFQNFRKAFSQLSSAAALAQLRELTELEQQGLIQAFEFTHELAWNTLKDFLESRGRSNLFGSKDATREAFTAGLIDNGDAWMQMIENRNETTHTYDEETADKIGEAILSRYVPQFEKFQARFMELECEKDT
jgi:nucleotidyltransferase substrate binding protein (TIGR01987 family)